ncbi:MAG: metalloregulator ArsR/SmtB family transcription factor [Thermostichales cyanobacterium HHBFW_bins_127]
MAAGSSRSGVLAQVAQYFKVLSEVSRLQLLCELGAGAKNVTELLAATGMGQANVSKHLKILSDAGMVSRHPKGVSVYYQLSDPACLRLCQVVCQQLLNQHQRQSQTLEQLSSLQQLGANPD